MGKKICGLIVLLTVFGGIFAPLPAAYAMRKTDKPAAKTLTDVKVTKVGDKLYINWKYSGLEGTKVKINLYQNGQLVRTIAENVSIGENGSGSAEATAGDNIGILGTAGQRKENSYGIGDTPYQIEVVSMTDGKLRVMSDKFGWDRGNK